MAAVHTKAHRKPREDYPPQENAWFIYIAADYAIWIAGGGQTYDFIELVLKEMLLRRFQYRNPRAIDHYRHTAVEEEEVLYGPRYRGFLEVRSSTTVCNSQFSHSPYSKRLRHKLNTLKRFKVSLVIVYLADDRLTSPQYISFPRYQSRVAASRCMRQ